MKFIPESNARFRRNTMFSEKIDERQYLLLPESAVRKNVSCASKLTDRRTNETAPVSFIAYSASGTIRAGGFCLDLRAEQDPERKGWQSVNAAGGNHDTSHWTSEKSQSFHGTSEYRSAAVYWFCFR